MGASLEGMYQYVVLTPLNEKNGIHHVLLSLTKQLTGLTTSSLNGVISMVIEGEIWVSNPVETSEL